MSDAWESKLLEEDDYAGVWVAEHIKIPGVQCPQCGSGNLFSELLSRKRCANCGAKLNLHIAYRTGDN